MKNPSEAPLLKIEDYSFAYPSYPGLPSRPLFKDLNFSLIRGEFWVILGNPESGKSTLCRCLTGLYPGFTRAETEGRILIDGENAVNRSACDWIDRVGTVLQGPDEQIVCSRCDDEAAFSLESMGIPEDEIQERMDQAFRQFAVTWPVERDPLSLSGGEKKRLLLAGLRMQDPDLWVLDETLDELDVESRISLMNELGRLAGQEGKGIILFASKYSSVFERPGVRMALLEGGDILPLDSSEQGRNTLRQHGLISDQVLSLTEDSSGGTSSSSLLEMDNVRYAYPGNPDFILQVDHLRIQPGSVSLFRGPNGCGKSTLAKLLCGILDPDEGSIRLRGKTADKTALNRYCGYLFQNPDYQLFLPTVEDELALGLKHSGHTRHKRKEMVDKAVELFRLPGGDAPPSLMSFGGRKRLQGAIYHLLDKGIYILDEADSGLNYEEYRLVTEQLKKDGASLIIISHNSELHYGKDVVLYRMEQGRLSTSFLSDHEERPE